MIQAVMINVFAGIFFLVLGLLAIDKPDSFLKFEHLLKDLLSQERRPIKTLSAEEKQLYKRTGKWFIGFAILAFLYRLYNFSQPC